MRRREVIAGIGAAAAWPLRARAQQARQLRRLGVLVTTGENDPEWGTERTAFLEAMQSLGWTDGVNVRVDYRFAAGDRDRLAASSKELVGLKPDVLLARSTTAVRALLAETRTIPSFSSRRPIPRREVRRKPRPAGRQRHRLHQCRSDHGRKMARAAERGRATPSTGRDPVQSTGGGRRRLFLRSTYRSGSSGLRAHLGYPPGSLGR